MVIDHYNHNPEPYLVCESPESRPVTPTPEVEFVPPDQADLVQNG